jgi:DNA-binding response OmpR family regulator
MPDSQQPYSILIIDDEDSIRSLLRLTLVRAGYEVIEAGSGEEGITLAQAKKPDLVLLDVMMPGMDGFAVCRFMRQDPALNNMPIIMLSARKDARSRQRSRQAGANGYLTKPWNPDELLWRVGETINTAETATKHGTS